MFAQWPEHLAMSKHSPTCTTENIFTAATYKVTPHFHTRSSTMMTRFVSALILACTLLYGTARSQSTTAFYEDFSSNKRSWYVGRTDSMIAVLDNGTLRYVRLAESGFQYDWKNVEINWANVNWTITARMSVEAGDDMHGASLCWGMADVDNFYGVTITHTGWIQVFQKKGGKVEPLLKWFQHPALGTNGTWNTIKIVRQCDAIGIFVNDSYVYGLMSSATPLFGSGVGFGIHARRAVRFDDLTVSYSPMPPLRLTKGIDTNQRRERLPASVNTAHEELLDAIMPDGKTIYVSRRGDPRNFANDTMSDIYVSRRQADGSWSVAEQLGRPINNEANNYVVTAMPDGNQLYIQNTYNADGSYAGVGVSHTQWNGTSWTLPKTLQIHNFESLSRHSSYYVAPDGLTLILAVQMSQTTGAQDLYVSHKQSDGTWSTPLSLGPTINTVGDDFGPFIAADNTTMIFSSSGHPGYGESDLFVTRRLDDTWTVWSEPENLGRPINSSKLDAFFMIPTEGDQGYFTSSEPGQKPDIYTIKVPIGALPQRTVIVRGTVYDATTKSPLAADIIYEKLGSNEQEGTATSNPSNGAYSIALSGNVAYAIRAAAKGYYALTENIDLTSYTSSNDVTKDLYLAPIVKDAVIRLNNIFFDSGKWDLRPESMPEVQRLAELLRRNASISIELAGHTDDVGNDAANVTLSQNRVNSVMNALIELGIEASRLTAKGYGETAPTVPNTSDENRQKNRRVEFRVVNK